MAKVLHTPKTEFNERVSKKTQKPINYSAPNKESTFSEILISAVKSTFSYSNHHKGSKNSFG